MRLFIFLVMLIGVIKGQDLPDTMTISTEAETKVYLTSQIDLITFKDFNFFDLVRAENLKVPEKFSISNNYPNPFNPSTKLNCFFPAHGKATVQIFDMKGGLVKEIFIGEVDPGSREFIWNGNNGRGTSVASGTYIFNVRFNTSQLAKKIIYLK